MRRQANTRPFGPVRRVNEYGFNHVSLLLESCRIDSWEIDSELCNWIAPGS